MLDLNKPVYIVVIHKGGRLAVLGGGQIREEAKALHAMVADAVLLRAVKVDPNCECEDD